MAAHLVALDDDWHEWRDPAGATPQVRVRVGEGADGRLHLVELRVEGVLSAELLRSIPVGRIEAAANAQLHPSAASPFDGDWLSGEAWPAPDPAVLPDALWRDAGGGYPDEFYDAVAVVYRRLAAASHRPVAELAGANDVPVTTAQRWVKEARRRGLLAPGRPGKAG
ncbi:MAG TPA: hypothetical protein VKB57_13105 [Acidimicrobiales bacterium]|nr:hypothetical protein [Acidimicrobiales bacterium]